jgi:hypothetical protein
MVRSVFGLFLIILVSFSSFAQQKKVPRPDLPGFFIVDFGFNQAQNKPIDFKTKFIGSHTVNLYYQYPIRFGKSKFSFNPGVGFSFERFKMKNFYTLLDTVPGTYQLGLHYTVQNTNNTFAGLDTLVTPVKKSQLVNNYFEVPLEFRFDSSPEDLSRSFNVAIGARFGLLLDAFTKIKYKQDGEVKKIKDKQNHGLSTYRYGIYTRIGVGAFNIFGFYNLTPLFEKDKGPDKTTMNTFTVGFSINGL